MATITASSIDTMEATRGPADPNQSNSLSAIADPQIDPTLPAAAIVPNQLFP